MCLPVESNTDPNKWEGVKVEVLGFSTKDSSSRIRGDRLKVSEMAVFSTSKCNDKLKFEIDTINQCKYNIKKECHIGMRMDNGHVMRAFKNPK